ncbi:MAG: hypothetical protein IIB69_01960 [Proteobacteria bacterium]|nr:hypothetical protein [Pseudomonadota bacterium]
MREQGKWDQASDECLKWLFDEPFSSRPARIGSYIGISLTNDHNYAEMCVRAGLQADSNDSILRNNLAVILAYQEKNLEAIEEFGRIKMIFDSAFPAVKRSMMIIYGLPVSNCRLFYPISL